MAVPTQTEAVQADRSFATDAGMIVNFVRAGSAPDFERVLTKLAEALANTEDVARRQQAAGWRIYNAQETGPNGNLVYVSFIDPTVSDADCAVTQILNEAFPAEVQTLYETYMGAFGPGDGQIVVNLELVQEFEP